MATNHWENLSVPSQESHTRQGAETAIEEELRPLVDKPVLERAGAWALFERSPVATSWWRTCFWKKRRVYWSRMHTMDILEASAVKASWVLQFSSFLSFHSHLADRGSAIAALELKPFLEKVFVAWQFYCCFSGWMLEVASFFSVSWFFSCDFRGANHWVPPHSRFSLRMA